MSSLIYILPRTNRQMLNRLRRSLFAIARSPISGYFMGWVFTYMSFLIPVERLRETKTLIAFHHPQPSNPVHILLVPKRPLTNMRALSKADTDFLADFLADLYQTVDSLVEQYQLEQGGYSLITNGGSYQDVPHLHFHLISDVDVTTRTV